MTSSELAFQVRTLGFAVVEQAFSVDWLEHYRRVTATTFPVNPIDYPARYSKGDFVAQHKTCWELPFDYTLRGLAADASGTDIAWIQQADIHVNVGTTLHRDSVNRERFGVGPDWDEHEHPYRIIRLAVNLYDSARSGSHFRVCPESHRSPRTDSVSLPVRAGDCIVFDARLLHGSAPPCGAKCVLVFCYGPRDPHSRRHQRWFLERRSADLGYRPIPDSLAERLKTAHLDLGD